MRRLQIIIGSTRPRLVGLPVAEWIHNVVQKHETFDDVQLVDLAEWNLRFMDEPHHPQPRRYEHQHTRDWNATIDLAGAVAGHRSARHHRPPQERGRAPLDNRARTTATRR